MNTQNHAMDTNSSHSAVAEQQTLQIVNQYIVNTASTLQQAFYEHTAELDNIMKTVERLQQQVELLEKAVQQPGEDGQGAPPPPPTSA